MVEFIVGGCEGIQIYLPCLAGELLSIVTMDSVRDPSISKAPFEACEALQWALLKDNYVEI